MTTELQESRLKEFGKVQKSLKTAMSNLDAVGFGDLADDTKAIFREVAKRFREENDRLNMADARRQARAARQTQTGDTT